MSKFCFPEYGSSEIFKPNLTCIFHIPVGIFLLLWVLAPSHQSIAQYISQDWIHRVRRFQPHCRSMHGWLDWDCRVRWGESDVRSGDTGFAREDDQRHAFLCRPLRSGGMGYNSGWPVGPSQFSRKLTDFYEVIRHWWVHIQRLTLQASLWVKTCSDLKGACEDPGYADYEFIVRFLLQRLKMESLGKRVY